MNEIGIGSTVWVQGDNFGPDRWKAFTIDGETRVSWRFTERGDIRKFPKKIKNGEHCRWATKWNGRNRVALSEAERDDLIFVAEQSRHIADKIYGVNDPAILRQIAALIGYDPGPPK